VKNTLPIYPEIAQSAATQESLFLRDHRLDGKLHGVTSVSSPDLYDKRRQGGGRRVGIRAISF